VTDEKVFPMRDYVVAVKEETGEVVKVWQGTRARRFGPGVAQYIVSMARGPYNAAARGQEVWAQVRAAQMHLEKKEG
jgi:hypothetical protein